MFGSNADANDIEATIPVEGADAERALTKKRSEEVESIMRKMFPIIDITQSIEKTENSFHDTHFGDQ